MRKIIVVFTVIILVFSCKNEKSPHIQLVSPSEMKTFIEKDDIQFVDIRTKDEYDSGYLKNAINLDFLASDFDIKMLTLDKTKPVYIYCRSGGRSAKCAQKMCDAGFVKVYDLDGGIIKWQEEGNEVIVQ